MKRMALLIAVAGCMPAPLTPPTPMQLHTARSIQEVVQASTRTVAAAGYDIAVSDAAAGTLTATRTASPAQFGSDVVCRMPKGSMGATMGSTTLRITVSARPVTGGSDVQIATRAVTSYSKTIGMLSKTPDSETDCVSSGAIEKSLATALATPTR